LTVVAAVDADTATQRVGEGQDRIAPVIGSGLSVQALLPPSGSLVTHSRAPSVAAQNWSDGHETLVTESSSQAYFGHRAGVPSCVTVQVAPALPGSAELSTSPRLPQQWRAEDAAARGSQ
jgi:hypothetical protein